MRCDWRSLTYLHRETWSDSLSFLDSSQLTSPHTSFALTLVQSTDLPSESLQWPQSPSLALSLPLWMITSISSLLTSLTPDLVVISSRSVSCLARFWDPILLLHRHHHSLSCLLNLRNIFYSGSTIKRKKQSQIILSSSSLILSLIII